jgi:hypothetical protein
LRAHGRVLQIDIGEMLRGMKQRDQPWFPQDCCRISGLFV